MNTREVIAWLAEFGRQHHGSVSGRAAAAAGITPAALRWQVTSGLLIRLAPNVYRLRDHPPTWHSRAWAALFEVEPLTAYLSHRSSGRLHGLYAYRDSVEIEITARRGRDHHVRLSRFHSTSLLDPEHVTIVEGIPCTTLARTIFDLCGDPDRRPIRSETGRTIHRLRMLQVVNDAIRRHGLRIEWELAVLAAIGKRGRPGTALVREIFAEIGSDYVPSESDLEVVFVELCRTAGLPAPDPQIWISDDAGAIGRVDFLFRPKLIVEIDSTWHDGPVDKLRDAARDDRLRALGYTVRRWRWKDLVLTPEKVVRQIRADLRRSEPAADPVAMTTEVTAH